MRTVFLGTPDFAVPSLRALASEHQVLAVFTQPDRPKGRGNQLAESPVKAAATDLGLAIHQPERIRRAEPVELLRSLQTDLMVVVGYGQIIPQTIIDLPPYGILNVHASLLPKYRGAAPIQWAIANGETETGVTIMQIDAGLDTGDMLQKTTVAIGPDETAPELNERLATRGAELLLDTIRVIEQGQAKREKQNDAEATFAPILKKEDGLIDWSRRGKADLRSSARVHSLARRVHDVSRSAVIVSKRKTSRALATCSGRHAGGQATTVCRLWKGYRSGIAGTANSRQETHDGRGFLERLQTARKREARRPELNLPLGYRYAATYAGIRKQENADLGLIVPDGTAEAAAVFTRNVVQAAPVQIARKHLQTSKGKVAAILVNAGNANCATRTGERVALGSCHALAKALKTKVQFVLPASTGVIGVELDQKLITASLSKLVSGLSPNGFEAVADAILTTDTRRKIAVERVRLKRGEVRVAGMTKGSGMIHPNMATTLGFVLTDAVLSASVLREMLAVATERSYNSLSVDGDMSTNDMVALLANGAAGVKPNSNERLVIQDAVCAVMDSLAKQIAADGEGARKLIVIRTAGFKTKEEARQVARAVSNSPLVKTAIAGSDPNWGRILAACGYAGVPFDPAKIDIFLQDVPVCSKGVAADLDEGALKEKLNRSEVRINIVLNGKGRGEARFFTCDFTEGYIQINGSYRS